MRRSRVTILGLAAAVLLAGCGNRDGDVTLTRLDRPGDGPDEFAILPNKPLQTPENLASLPTPTPGAGNLVDPTPRADGIVALGGNPAARQTGGIPGRDGALVAHAARHGGNPAIRATLAQEDREVRRRHGRVNILPFVPRDNYASAYKPQTLDPSTERDRLRRRGVRTPSAPPTDD